MYTVIVSCQVWTAHVLRETVFEFLISILWKTCVFVPDRLRMRYNPNVVPDIIQRVSFTARLPAAEVTGIAL